MARKKRIKRFYLNGNLHGVLHLHKAKDRIVAVDYVEKKVKTYAWSDVKRNKQNAFTITEAARLVDRHRDRIWEYMKQGYVEWPQREVDLETGREGRYFFSEDGVLSIWEHMTTIHIGRPRNDGRVTNNRLPTKEQLKAMMNSNKIMYIKEEGEFKPIWRAEEW